MKRNNLDVKHNAFEMIIRSMEGGAPVIFCPAVPRPRPVRRSGLKPLLPRILEMSREGRSLGAIAEWIGEATGQVPARSTVLRLIRGHSGG